MGSASPLARCTPHDSFSVSNLGIRQQVVIRLSNSVSGAGEERSWATLAFEFAPRAAELAYSRNADSCKVLELSCEGSHVGGTERNTHDCRELPHAINSSVSVRDLEENPIILKPVKIGHFSAEFQNKAYGLHDGWISVNHN